MIYRQAKEPDLKEMVTLKIQLQKHLEEIGLWKASSKAHEQYLNIYKRHLQNKESRLLIAIDNQTGKIAGIVTAWIINNPILEMGRYGRIDDLFVLVDFRRKKTGTQLLKLAIEFFEEQKITHITLEYAYFNKEANAFWEKHNMKPLLNLCHQSLNEIKNTLQ